MFRRDTQWIKKHFIHSNDYYKGNKSYRKSWCKYCVAEYVRETIDKDIAMVNDGSRTDGVRTEQEIEAERKPIILTYKLPWPLL